MLAEAREIFEELKRRFARLDVAALSGDEATEIVAFGAEVAGFATALQTLCAESAARTAPWRDNGRASEAVWLAELTRTSAAEAARTIEASGQLASLPATSGAALRGELSPAQLRAVASAAAADPESEHDLLEAAAVVGIGTLNRLAGDVKRAAAAAVPGEPDGDLTARRFLRFWRDQYGMVRVSGAFTAEAGAHLLSAVRSRAEFAADDARRAQRAPEPQAAYDADALVALCLGDLRRATFSGQVAIGPYEMIGLPRAQQQLERSVPGPAEGGSVLERAGPDTS